MEYYFEAREFLTPTGEKPSRAQMICLRVPDIKAAIELGIHFEETFPAGTSLLKYRTYDPLTPYTSRAYDLRPLMEEAELERGL